MADVDDLKRNADEEAYLLVVDSQFRDTSVYPTPSEYRITFTNPFTDVFGMDLLDASIPRTEYLVEYNTNTLEYCIDQPVSLAQWDQGSWASMRRRTVVLDPGDYNLPQLVEHLNAKLAAVAPPGEPALRCAPLTTPSETGNRLALTCPSPFTLLASSSTVRHTLGFGDPVTETTNPAYAVVPGWSPSFTGGASDAFLSRPEDGTSSWSSEPSVATAGPVPAAPFVQIEKVFGSSVVRQFFTSTSTGPVTRVLVYVSAAGDAPVLDVSIHRVADHAVMATGSLTVAPGDAMDAYSSVACDVIPQQPLLAGTAYYVRFAARGGGDNDYVAVYYNDDNLATDDTRYYTRDDVVVTPGQQLCCDVVTSTRGHALTSPGLVNLSGPRYVNIRCPEIESHMFRDRVNERCHAGLGMVKLRGYGFREQRFDFVSFPPRRFHAIGRLPSLTFRLERPDGTLYDSHGVDHTMLVVLRYYRHGSQQSTTAKAVTTTTRQMLNPHYLPNLTEYQKTRVWPREAAVTPSRTRYT